MNAPFFIAGTLKIVSDLLLYYSFRSWQRIVTDPHVTIVPERDLIAIKLRWTFRL